MTKLKLRQESVQTIKSSHLAMSKMISLITEEDFGKLVYENFEDEIFSVTNVNFRDKTISLKFSKTKLKKSKLTTDQYVNNMVNSFISNSFDIYSINQSESVINSQICHTCMTFNNNVIVKFKSQ